jgi:hypothetical protein
MYIKEVLDPEYGGFPFIVEADLIVTDGTHELLCYFYDLNKEVKKGAKVQYISTLEADPIMRAATKEYAIKKDKNSHYGFSLQGELVNVNERIMKIGDLEIEFDGNLYKGAAKGDFIRFNVNRLDCALEQDYKIKEQI